MTIILVNSKNVFTIHRKKWIKDLHFQQVLCRDISFPTQSCSPCKIESDLFEKQCKEILKKNSNKKYVSKRSGKIGMTATIQQRAIGLKTFCRLATFSLLVILFIGHLFGNNEEGTLERAEAWKALLWKIIRTLWMVYLASWWYPSGLLMA